MQIPFQLQRIGNIARWNGPAEQKSLPQLASKGPQDLKLLLCLDAFGDPQT